MQRLIVILGTTGVGKSDLAVHIAKIFNGEIINGDSMQVYKGLDVITNKMPINERNGIPHHLMDFLDIQKEYTVKDFLPDAINAIDSITSRDHLPILVGGTNYYIQSLLWKDGLTGSTINEKPLTPEQIKILHGPVEKTFQELSHYDPIMARRWHPSDVRKIRRSLQIWYMTGQKHSDLIKETSNKGIRFSTCIFWLHSQQDELEKRLDKRVEKMIQNGLFNEILSMRKSTDNVDFTRGLFQAIGYKEFDSYLNTLEKNNNDSSELKLKGLEIMKLNTKKYAKRQVKWIQNKLIPLCLQDGVHIYKLDATDLSKWNEVLDKAEQITKDFLNGHPPSSSINVTDYPRKSGKSCLDTIENHKCEICSQMTGKLVILSGQTDWDVHLKSKSHIRHRDYDKRQEEIKRLREEAEKRRAAKYM